ncbi:substrate-binding domain-containing protein [Microbacterium sp. DT81.1]|uniref:substrate-binding domain-containing protein n=1 Tax=Microbacterium sp. DT81.1 TaxID=3393413 RepID=UPI003CEFD8EA
MKTESARRSRRTPRLMTATIVAGGVVALLLAGCTSTTGGGGAAEDTTLSDETTDITVDSVDPEQLADTIRKAFLTDIPVEDLDPVVADTLAVASEPLNEENEALLAQCLQQPVCDTGRGTLKVGIPIFVTANAYTNVNRAEATAQLLAYPEVKEIHYSISNGDIAASISNVQNLITQDVDAIIVDLALGAAMNSVLQEATDAGIIVINVNTPASADTLPILTMDFPTGLCETYRNGVEALTSSITEPSSYMLFTGIPGNDNAAAWQPCAEDAFAAAGWRALPGGFTNWNSQGEAQAANALRASGEKPGAIVYDFSADQLVQPFIDAGETPPAVISGVSTYSWLATSQAAEAAGLPIQSWISNGHVWFSRLAVTGAIQTLHGADLPQQVTMDLPMGPTADVLESDWEGIPADSVISSLLTNDQISLALAAG